MRQITYGLLACGLLLGCGQPDEKDNAPNPATRGDLSALVSDMAANHAVSGVVLVTLDGETIYEEAFNVASLKSDFEVQIDSVFSIASITKSFTATLVMTQVESGRINLDATIRDYLPDFEADYAESVTVRQLLQNRSGIPHYVDIPGWFEPDIKSKFTRESFLAAIAALELRFTPGDDYYYSNPGYFLLGLILDATTGRDYEVLLSEEILGPLELEHTGQIYAPGLQTLTPAYLRDGDSYERVTITNPALFRATGSQFASAADLATFGRELVNGSILGEEMQAVLLDPDRPMGFMVTSAPLAGQEVPLITYNGELVGATTMLTMYPEQDGTIVILSNSNVPYNALVEMTLAIAETAFE